jgi:predicted nucleic acid-binding protein
MVLIASLDPEHTLHRRALHHLRRVATEQVYVPSPAILEMDLELKTHGFTRMERREACTSLLGYVGEEKVLPLTFEAMAEASDLEQISGYFDALIGAVAKVRRAALVTKDRAFIDMGLKIEW